ncbi:MAG TPA: glycosyltransferase family 39 protein [Anaerolineales bacterium]
MSHARSSLLAPSRPALIALVMILLGLGLAIRVFDLSDLPLDYHPTRQLLSQLKARGMYYQAHPELPDWQRKIAIQQWRTRVKIEPEVFERLVVFTYEFTGVNIAVARVYASIFWLLSGVFIFLLVREYVSTDAALVSLAYFLFFPYDIIASRSFQPDIPMLMLITCFWWSFSRWLRSPSWGWALLAGLAGGFAIFVKFVAVFFVIGAGAGMAIHAGVRALLKKPQSWLIAALGVLPSAAYLYYGMVVQGYLGQQFSGRFIPALLLNPFNYLQWSKMANLAAGGVAIAVGLLGVLLARNTGLRSLLMGLWISYVLYGLFFDYHMGTHDYYQLPLVAIVAVSFAPVTDSLMESASSVVRGGWARAALLALFAYCVFNGLWTARIQMSTVDYRPEAAMWSEIGDRLNHGPNVVALSQDYGTRLAYWGWQDTITWPGIIDAAYREARGGSIGFDELFAKLTLGNTYFLVTDFAELERQPFLKQRLLDYQIYAQGAGYVIYDLERPVGAP